MRYLASSGITLASVVASLHLLAPPAAAFGGPPFGPRGPGNHLERFLETEADELGLDESTREAIRKVIEERRDQARQLEEALHDAHGAMRDLLMQEEVDRDAVMRQAELIGQIETDRSKHRLETLMEARALLSPEQLSLLTQRHKRRFETLLDACASDLEALCPDAEPDPGVFHCLRGHREDLSEQCRDALPRHRFEGHRRGGPGRW
jgi:Spy/CpxP family protein refolding chaperone